MDAHNQKQGLWRLPPEIRAQIWCELRPNGFLKEEQATESLGVLRTCRRLHDEINPILYDKEVLHFWVEANRSKWLRIENLGGRTWTISGIRDPLNNVFANVPFQRLQSIRISIEAIENGDLAQLIRLSQNIRNLVTLLEQATALPPLEIFLLDTSVGQWAAEDGWPKTTLEDHQGLDDETDYMTVLLPFCKLRNLPKVSIHVPETLLKENLDTWAVEILMQKTTSYGSFVDRNPLWDDKGIQYRLDRLYMFHEANLDILPGKVADMMRLERFVSWYDEDGKSKYLKEWERILHGEESSEDFDSLQNRHNYLVSFNPLSAGMQRLRLQLGLSMYLKISFYPTRAFCDLYWGLSDLLDLEWEKFRWGLLCEDPREIRTTLKASWSAEEWRSYYPEGIPPYSDKLTSIFWDLGEENRHEDGMSASKKPRGLNRIRAQAALIDFSSGQHTKQKFDNMNSSPFQGKPLEELEELLYLSNREL